jgi:hypothetical protein
VNAFSGQYGCTVTNLFNSDTQEDNFRGNVCSHIEKSKYDIFMQVLVYLSMEHLLLVVRCPLPAPLILGFSLSIGYAMDMLYPQQKVPKES